MPRSSHLVAEDGEYSLYSVVLFRRVADSFKANARTRGFQVRLLVEKPTVTGNCYAFSHGAGFQIRAALFCAL